MPPIGNPTSTPRQDIPLSPNQWVDRHGSYLYRFALSRVRRQEVAEELVQETLLAAWKGRKSFRGKSSERTWLVAILKRKVIDWLRESVKRRAHEKPGHDVWATAQFTPRGTWRAAPGQSGSDVPTDGPSRDEFWQEFQACLDALPLRLRDIFVLKYLEESSSQDVCAQAGISANNLWVMLHRARLRLASCLNQHWFETEEDQS